MTTYILRRDKFGNTITVITKSGICRSYAERNSLEKVQFDLFLNEMGKINWTELLHDRSVTVVK